MDDKYKTPRKILGENLCDLIWGKKFLYQWKYNRVKYNKLDLMEINFFFTGQNTFLKNEDKLPNGGNTCKSHIQEKCMKKDKN